MKCDYCGNKSTYSIGIVLEKETIDIFCCDKHIENAKARQDSIIGIENLKQKINMETKKINTQPIFY